MESEIWNMSDSGESIENRKIRIVEDIESVGKKTMYYARIDIENCDTGNTETIYTIADNTRQKMEEKLELFVNTYLNGEDIIRYE